MFFVLDGCLPGRVLVQRGGVRGETVLTFDRMRPCEEGMKVLCVH